MVKRSGQEFSIPRLPIFVYFVVIVSTSLPLIAKLITGIVTYNKWKHGDLPRCPTCQGPMKMRTAKRGQFSGQRFWGCYTFPVCRGKEHIGW